MMADRWLSWFLLIVWGAVFLVGCIPKNTSKFLTDHGYLSSWIQAIGSLAAVWSTYYIYRTDSKARNEAENIKSNIERSKSESFILANNSVRVLILNLHGYAKSFPANFTKIWCEECERLPNADIYYRADNIVRSFIKFNIRPFYDEEISRIFGGFGNDVIVIQRSLLIIQNHISTMGALLPSVSRYLNRGDGNGIQSNLFDGPFHKSNATSTLEKLLALSHAVSNEFDLIRENIEEIHSVANVLSVNKD